MFPDRRVRGEMSEKQGLGRRGAYPANGSLTVHFEHHASIIQLTGTDKAVISRMLQATQGNIGHID